MLSYATQLKLKQDIVADSFKKLKMPELNILPIVGSPLEKGYRNKIEFSFGKYITNGEQVKNGEAREKQLNVLSDRSVGFHRQGEFSKIVDITNCGLISDQANEVFARVKGLCLASGLPVYDQKTHQGFFRHLVIREGFHTGQFLVNLSVSEENLKTSKSGKWDQLLEVLKKDELLKDKVTTFVITYNNGLADTIRNDKSETKTFWGDGYMYEKLVFGKTEETGRFNGDMEINTQSFSQSPTNHQIPSEVSFRISPFSFFQTNTLGAQQLFSLGMHIAGQVEGNILDLYCGTGSIGLSFLKAGKGEQLIGIEIVEEAITDARYNAKINGLENQVLFVANPAEKALTSNDELRAKIKNIGLVIVDPPRDGLHKNVISFLADLKKEQNFKLLYISCNPVTMVRDIELFAAQGFQIQTVQPVDMFPQTHHIEVIGLLI
ncbi:MAG: methyltransferase domain-containing protein [candidate division SR1 bacterium]|nr:methyltransferase domain-containing protein [candidate division SR1 bacterium]